MKFYEIFHKIELIFKKLYRMFSSFLRYSETQFYASGSTSNYGITATPCFRL